MRVTVTDRIENTGGGSSRGRETGKNWKMFSFVIYSDSRIFQRQEPKMLFVLTFFETLEQTSKQNIVHGLKN